MSSPTRPHLDQFLRRVANRWKEVASTMMLDFVSLGALLVIFPLITRGLGPDHYGEYTILYLIFGLAGLWVFAGPTAATVQLILQLEFDSDEVLRLVRRQVYLVGVAGGLVGTSIALALLGWNILIPALLVLFADFIITSLANVNLASVFAIEGVVRSSRARLPQPLVRVSGVIILAIIGHISVATLVVVNLTSSLALLAVSMIIIQRRVAPTAERHRPTAREVLKYSWYYSTTMSTNAVQNEGEKFVLAATRPAPEIGQYAASYRIVSTTLMPLGAVVAAANRWFMVPDDREGAHLQRAMRLAVPTIAYGVVAGVGIVLGSGVIQRFAGDEFDQAGLIAVWLCALPLLHGLGELAPMGLLGLGRNRERMWMGLVSSAIAVIAYLVLAPWFGWRGAVLGTYISESIGIAIGWILLRRYQRRADSTAASPCTV